MDARSPEAVLIVEDETYIAMAVEESLLDAGYRSCGIAASEAAALRLSDAHLPSVAVVDINLGQGGNGMNVGRDLAARGVAVLYASGNCLSYKREMTETGALGYMTKPYALGDVEVALRILARVRVGQAPAEDLPASLHLLPRALQQT